MPPKSSIFLRFLDPLCTVLHLLQKTNQGNITAVKDDVKKVFYRIWDVIWTLIFWFLSIAIFLRILNWCSQVQLNCQRKKTLNKIYFNIFLSIIYLILVQWGTRWSKHFYFVTSQRAQNYEAHNVLLNLLLRAQTFVHQKSKFFQLSYTTTFFWFSFDFNQCSGYITFLYLLKHKTRGSQATMKRGWNELAILNN